MSQQAVIGALRVVFSADDDGFDQTCDNATAKVNVFEKAVSQMADTLRDAGAKIAKVGAGLSAAITVPMGALATSAVRTAGQFEAAMKRVEAALDNVSPAQLEALEKQARTMGPALGYGATQAAGAIEDLAKNGLDTANILDGGLAAAMKLAASAGEDDLAPAADLTTDIMQQFGKKAGELGPVVDKVSGALLASKFGFQDYQLAVGQAGGVAGSVGVTFEDFNTALAGTSALFQSGSDAGTSFKTFLTNLTGNSKQAKKEMSDLGMSFFDANHNMKSMADVAGVLQKALGGLSEEARNKVLTDVFGTDGMRTAIGLMRLGKTGFIDLQNTIAKASADKQVGKMQEGYAAAMGRLAAAFENLKISIGKSGLLDIATAFANAMTRLVNGLATLHPMLMKIGAAFSAVAAALGPLMVVLGGALWIAVGFFLRRMLGPLGWALSALVEPIGTLIAAFVRLVAAFGASTILRGVATMFAEMLGPIGLAIGAFMILKDSIIPVLQRLWDTAQRTLGPPLQALLTKVGAIFSGLAGGPIVSAIGAIIDILGTLAALVVDRLGAAFIQGAGIIIGVLNTLVTLVQDVVTIVTDLLQGDFAGAWAAAEQFVSDAVQGIVDIVKGLFPGASEAIQAFYEGAKMVLGTAFGAVADYFGGMVEWAVNAVTNAFPRAVQAAKDLYNGIKQWLVDAMGPVWSWIQGFANAVGNMWRALKETLGLGGDSGEQGPAPAPTAPVAPPKQKPVATNHYMPPDPDAEKKKREKHGETPEDLKVQAEIEAARLRNDKETEQRLQDQLDLQKKIEAYQRAGLSLTNARAAAERDMKEIIAARAEANAREIGDTERGVRMEAAKLVGNKQLEDSLQRQADIEQRINFYRAHSLSLVDATRRAEEQQLLIDQARAKARADWTQQDADQRAVNLAQLRGDTDEEVRQRQRVLDIEKRTKELVESSGMSTTAARAQAVKEAAEDEQARVQGVFRSTIRAGFQAALSGDFKSWFTNWLSSASQKAWEKALNSLSDLLQKLMGQLGASMAGHGGILGSIGKTLAGIAGGVNLSSLSSPSLDIGGAIPSTMAVSAIDVPDIPGFATGGSFKVGGMAGIDQNVVKFRATKGEMVNITKGGNDNGPVGTTNFQQHLNVPVGMDLATRTETYRLAEVTRQAAIDGMQEINRRAGR